MADSLEYAVGMKIGGAILEEKIGEGGQAVVYRAYYCDEKVAIKLIKPHLNPILTEDALQRFESEQEVHLLLKYKNIVEVKAAGTQKLNFEGKVVTIPFLIMELMAGPVYDPAAEPLPWAKVVKIGIDAAEGLLFVHNQGLHHRDIKPSNILLNKKGKAKIADFGFARALDTYSKSLTLPYASPEQHNPHQCTDHVSDIYSLGITCYEMLTGRWPFAKNERALQLYINGLSVPESINIQVPDMLKELIMKMISLNRIERPQSVEEVIDAFKKLQHEFDDEDWLFDGPDGPPEEDPDQDEKEYKKRYYLKLIALAALSLAVFATSTLYYTGRIGNKPSLPSAESVLISDDGQSVNGSEETALVNDAVNAPTITFKTVPGYGDQGMLQGTVSSVEPSNYRVAVYVMVRGRWWTKPYWDQPLTEIKSNGSWECDIFTGELDHETSRVAAYLLPEGYNPPLLRGDASLPEELNSISVANVLVDRNH
jgi:serine/threonine protein kinase